MNEGTYYLYEYNSEQPLRCAGFIRITEHYHSCVLQFHAKTGSAADDGILHLSAFILTGDRISASLIGALPCHHQEINTRLSVPERTFPDGCTLSGIDGFLIGYPDRAPSAPGRSVFLVAADPLPPAEVFSKTPEETTSVPEEPVPDSALPGETGPKLTMSETSPDDPEQVPGPVGDLESAEKKSEIQARKIKRSDLTLLPRRFWSLANNSFLLHGYHNYSHLLLLEEDGRLWLGVPGIYDPREARAADLFGFPRFTHEGVSALDLCENECCTDENFGHWCRCIR